MKIHTRFIVYVVLAFVCAVITAVSVTICMVAPHLMKLVFPYVVFSCVISGFLIGMIVTNISFIFYGKKSDV